MLHNRTDVADSNSVSTKSLTAIPSSTEVEWHTVNASSFLMKNAYIRERISDIDWHFWDLHVGDHDIEHRRRTRDLINDAIVIANEHGLLQLGRGFGESMISWRSFWENIFESTRMNSASIERGRDRQLARDAFTPDVPAELLRPRQKAGIDGFVKETLHRNMSFVRETLLDGDLVGQKLLDRGSLERALSSRPEKIDSAATDIFDYLTLEIWLRTWSSRRQRVAA